MNKKVFSDAYVVSSHKDINGLKTKLDTFDIVEYCTCQRPDTKYMCVCIT